VERGDYPAQKVCIFHTQQYGFPSMISHSPFCQGCAGYPHQCKQTSPQSL